MNRSVLIKIDGVGNESVTGPFPPLEARKLFYGEHPGIKEIQWVNTVGGLHKTRRFNLSKPAPKAEPQAQVEEKPKRGRPKKDSS